MNIIGIDPGITVENPCGVVVLAWNDGHPCILHAEEVFRKGAPVAGLTERLEVVVNLFDLDGIGVEMPWFGKNAQTALRLGEVVGIVISLAVRHHLPLLRVQPTEAKLALTGSGAASKEQMRDAVRQQFGRVLNKDAADAVGAALHAGAALARSARILERP